MDNLKIIEGDLQVRQRPLQLAFQPAFDVRQQACERVDRLPGLREVAGLQLGEREAREGRCGRDEELVDVEGRQLLGQSLRIDLVSHRSALQP